MEETAAELEVRGRILLGQAFVEDGLLRIGAGRVLWAGEAAAAPAGSAAQRLRLRSGSVVPGLVDIHVHGAGGADALDGSEAIERLRRLHVAGGTVALCPTLLSAAPEVLLRAVAEVRALSEAPPDDGAAVLGAHLEGPFLNPRRAGAHPKEHLRGPDLVLVEELLAAAGPALKIVTLAPELPGALEVIARLTERGVLVSLGHSEASYAETMRAVAAGARSVTHVFNAMAPLHHREVGLVGAALSSEALVAEVIADGVHLSPAALRLVWQLKGPERLALITDAVAALGAEGRASLGGRPIEAREGAARLADGTLAGSLLTLGEAVRNLADLAGAPIAAAVRAASETPCRLLALPRRGTLGAGQQADLCVLDAACRVRAVFVAGRLVSGEVPDELTGWKLKARF